MKPHEFPDASAANPSAMNSRGEPAITPPPFSSNRVSIADIATPIVVALIFPDHRALWIRPRFHVAIVVNYFTVAPKRSANRRRKKSAGIISCLFYTPTGASLCFVIPLIDRFLHLAKLSFVQPEKIDVNECKILPGQAFAILSSVISFASSSLISLPNSF